MRAMKLGKLITFEGIDGCGKSTQMRLLEQYLTERGLDVVTTREPGGTELGKKIRSALLDGGEGSVEPLAELLLYAADRAQHVRRVIMPALAEGKMVLSDRFYDATTVYQGYARGFDLTLVNQLNELATGGLKPALTLLFDLDVETARPRRHVDEDPRGRIGAVAPSWDPSSRPLLSRWCTRGSSPRRTRRGCSGCIRRPSVTCWQRTGNRRRRPGCLG